MYDYQSSGDVSTSFTSTGAVNAFHNFYQASTNIPIFGPKNVYTTDAFGEPFIAGSTTLNV